MRPKGGGGGGGVTAVTGVSPIVSSGGAAPAISLTIPNGEILIGQAGNVPGAHAVGGDATLADDGTMTLDTVNGNVGTFGDATHVARVTVNGKGLVTAVSAVAISGGGGGGTVDSVTGTAPIVVDNTDPANPVVSHAASGVSPGVHGNAVVIPTFNVDADGHLIAVGDENIEVAAPLTNNGTTLALTPPAYVWEDNASTLPVTIAGVSISPTITPEVSGKLTVRVTGIMQSTDSAATHTMTMSITGTLGLDYVSGTAQAVPREVGVPGNTAFAMNVALDKLPVPFLPPVGTPITFNVNFSADDDTHVSILAHSVQVEVQERFA